MAPTSEYSIDISHDEDDHELEDNYRGNNDDPGDTDYKTDTCTSITATTSVLKFTIQAKLH